MSSPSPSNGCTSEVRAAWARAGSSCRVRRATGTFWSRFRRWKVGVVPDAAWFVGYVPGWPGAHSQGTSVDELRQNLEEVVAMLLEDDEPKLQGEFVGTQTVNVA
jgi:predicted RNase H-like HicB family nuclease